MRLFHLLHFLGVAFAAPSKGKANSLSIFDNPTIPWNSSDSLSLPFLSHVRRAGSIMALNVSTCPVTVTPNPYWYRDYTTHATLYITSPINSPGTKNGANIFEMFIRLGNPHVGGGLVFTTNQFVMDLNSQPLGPKNIDYARTVISSTGAMVAYVDYANLDHPEFYSPIRYNNERRKTSDDPRTSVPVGFDPPTEVVAKQDSGISVTVKDQGVITGFIVGYPINGSSPFHYYSLNGGCWNQALRFPVSS